MRLALLASAALLAFAPATAYAHGGKESSADVPAQALAVQALAMLEANMAATDARDSVQAALRAMNQDDIRVDRLRAAKAALERNDVTGARRELEAAFNSDDQHLIGTTFTGGDDARIVAAIVGAILVAAALLLLLRQDRTRRSPTTSRPGRC